jgi:hypothetical protein
MHFIKLSNTSLLRNGVLFVSLSLQGCNINAPGAKEVGDGQFQRPHDLDFDAQEKYLYTLDRDGNRVQVFDKMEHS